MESATEKTEMSKTDTESVSYSSEEAVKIFKSQIGQSLPLLGFMNSSDKENVWTFWKTISAAVKIAVNGKGDIVHMPKYVYMNDVEVGKDQLQNLEGNLSSIFVSVKSPLKSRFVNSAKVGNTSGGFNVQKPSKSESPSIADITSIKGVDSNTQSETLIPECATGGRDDSHAVAQQSHVAPVSSSYLIKDASIKPSQSVSQLATRCSTSSEKPMIVNNNIYSKITPSIHDVKDKNPISSNATCTISDTSQNTIQGASFIKDFRDERTNHFDFPNDDSLLAHILKNSDVLNSQVVATKDMNNTPVTSAISSENIALSQHTQFSSHKNIEANTVHNSEQYTGSLTQSSSMNNVNNLPQRSDVDVGSLHHVSQYDILQNHEIQPRNTSDLETIICALELEIKRAGKDGTAREKSQEAINGSNYCLNYSHNNSQTPVSICSKSPTIYQASMPDMHMKSTSNISSSQTDNELYSPSETQMDVSDVDIQTKTSENEQSLQTNNETRMPCREASSGEINNQSNIDATNPTASTGTTHVHDSSQPIRLRIAAYVDDTGEPICQNFTSYADEFGQPLPLVQEQEVDGRVENFIWAYNGEAQNLEQPNQRDEMIEVENRESSKNNCLNLYSQTTQELPESQPIQELYDVVEYEILSDRRIKRGRRKKVRTTIGSDESSNIAAGDAVGEGILDRTCPICHRVLHYASSMQAHMRIHTGARPFICGQCERKFTTKANRDRHEATHVGLKPFKCEECDKSFTEKRSLKIHMRSHTGERPFACETCGQTFAQKCTLQVHTLLHTNRRAHLCELCGKAFKQKNQLDIHVKRHNRTAPYPCQHCTTRCYTKGDLLRHMVKHTGERPFVCKLCSRAFTRKQYLSDHMNQHYGRKPYSCSACSMAFYDKASCNRHVRKHKTEEKTGKKQPTTGLELHKLNNVPIIGTEMTKVLDSAKPGQLVRLDNGTDAMVKQVTSEADGSIVYHITCLNMMTPLEASINNVRFDVSPSDVHDVVSNSSSIITFHDIRSHPPLQEQVHGHDVQVKVEGSSG